MAITKEKKKEVVAEIKGKLKDAESVVFVNFHGLSVDEDASLRSSLKQNDCDYKVAKKTLIRIALDQSGPEGEIPSLEGEVALSFSEDQTAPAREIFNFSKTMGDKVKILGGILENKYISKEEVENLATIPAREVLYGQFVNVINAPVSGFVGVLNNTVSSFVRTLGEITKVKS
jgi:large subunit ribosomal protein L10